MKGLYVYINIYIYVRVYIFYAQFYIHNTLEPYQNSVKPLITNIRATIMILVLVYCFMVIDWQLNATHAMYVTHFNHRNNRRYDQCLTK